MQKISTLMLFLFLSVTALNANAQTWQRKKLSQPFFVPQHEQVTAEKLPPIYMPQAPKSMVKKINADSDENATTKTTLNAPEYQQKYQDYLTDAEYISKTGKYPQNNSAQQDLQTMNSNERIVLDQNFNENRNVKQEFNSALKKSLQQQ